MNKIIAILLFIGVVGAAPLIGNADGELKALWNSKALLKLALYEELNYSYKEFKLLDEIITCESGWENVISRTHDHSIFQLNEWWIPKAKELGYNIDDPQENIKMGVWVFKKYGPTPWVCYNKKN